MSQLTWGLVSLDIPLEGLDGRQLGGFGPVCGQALALLVETPLDVDRICPSGGILLLLFRGVRIGRR